MRTPISYYGGKQNMLNDILPLLPQHTMYCEPFIGGGAVFFAKEPAKVEVINDINREIVNFYQVLVSKFDQLKKLIDESLHSRFTHKQARVIYENPEMFDEIKRAWAVFILANQSFGKSFTGGWGYCNQKNDSMTFDNKKRLLTVAYKERLERTQIECNDAINIIRNRDGEDTLFYCDPPYYNADMGHYGGYTEANFDDLCKSLACISGKFLMSSYPSDLLMKHIHKNMWYYVEFDKPLSMARKQGKRKTEVLTANYDIISLMK